MAEVGRPSKYSTLTIKQAMAIKEPCVYFIKNINGYIVYIGKTKNPSKRFENYKYKISHNRLLNSWLGENTPYFGLILCNEKDLNCIEKKYIHEYKNNGIFNKIAGGEYPWIIDKDIPWSAGHIKSPSSLIITYLINRTICKEKLQQVREAIKRMSDIQRCCFEVSLAKDCYDNYTFHDRIEKWLSIVEPKLVRCMEGVQNG